MKKIKLSTILLIICLILSTICLFQINKIGVLPFKYLLILIGIFLVINALVGILLFRKNKVCKVLGIIFGVIIILVNGIGIYYINSTNNFLDKAFSGKVIESTTYYVIAKKDNNYTEKDIKGDIYYYKNMANSKKVVKLLKDDYELVFKEYELINDMTKDLLENKIKFIVMEKTSYSIIKQHDTELSNNTVILKEINIKEEKKSSEVKGEAFNIYVVGTDFAGLNDFNMIISVNTQTKKILLTSIPRDYHIEVAGMNGVKDNITYMSALGVDTSIKSLENFFDTKIDYYVKINTSSLVTLVDKIGGINYCSEHEFTTTHAMVLDTYNDSVGKKLYVKKGCQHLNGIQTLTVARERKNIPGSDLARQDNCRKIIIAIFSKLKSLDTVLNYNDLLQSLSNSYETTLSKETIQTLGKETLQANSKWEIMEQAVNGVDVIGYVHLNTVRDYTMEPNMNSVDSAIKNIDKIVGD